MSDSFNTTSQFLMQASLGADYSTIERVAQEGIEEWLEQQLNTPWNANESYLKLTSSIWQEFRAKLLTAHGEEAINGEGNNPALPYWYYFRMAWWHKALESKSQDLLRQRVAQALSEIIVISDKSNLQLDALGMADFYDILYQNAFGNYGDILEQVSLHPMMGVYLSHLNNQKANVAQNIHPDENYAREIMQLFSIGLNQLNGDGSEKIGADGNPIPTYSNQDIKELARVFTGLKGAEYLYEWNSAFGYNHSPLSFDDGVEKIYKTIPFINMLKPMQGDENYHDRGAKILLDGAINVPANQSVQADIQKVVSDLMNHPNTAPFIAKKMIQQLVTSNPSPAYIKACARAFGTQGDMRALIKTILTHSEASKPEKLKSPMLRTTQILKAFGASNQSQKLWVIGDSIEYGLEHHILSSPTVFNFYLPDYAPHGEIANANQVAPEFQIHNSATSIGYINLMYQWSFGGTLPMVSTQIHSQLNNITETEWEVLEKNTKDKLHLNLETEIALAQAQKFDELIEHMALILTGNAKLDAHDSIKEAFKNYAQSPEWVVQTVLFMIVISPEFTVLKG